MSVSNLTASLDEMKEKFDTLSTNMDVMFLLFAADIVIFLQAGFAFLEAGVVRSKNASNILMQNMMDLFISGIAFWVFGYAFAFGEGNSFIGWTKFASSGMSNVELAHWFFQYTFAATAATIINGGVAERCNFIAYTIYSFFISGFLYPVLVHWAWTEQGWLARGSGDDSYHFVDFAGSGIVHLCGGVCSFVGSAVLGPRIGRFDPDTGKPNDIKYHSLPFAALGGFILIFGIISFNGGSQGHISAAGDGGVVAVTITNTIIAGCFGAVTTMVLHKSGVFGTPKQWSFLYSLNGSLLAMISTCAGVDSFYPWGAAVIGIVAAPFFFLLRYLMLKLKVDDPLDAAPVHVGGGLWGLIAAVIFSRDKGLIYSTGEARGYWILWNVIGMVSIIAWSAGLSLVLFLTMKYFGIFRTSPQTEIKGLDYCKHGEPAYPASAWEEEQYGNGGNGNAYSNGAYVNSESSVPSVDGGGAMLGLGIHPLMVNGVRRPEDIFRTEEAFNRGQFPRKPPPPAAPITQF